MWDGAVAVVELLRGLHCTVVRHLLCSARSVWCWMGWVVVRGWGVTVVRRPPDRPCAGAGADGRAGLGVLEGSGRWVLDLLLRIRRVYPTGDDHLRGGGGVECLSYTFPLFKYYYYYHHHTHDSCLLRSLRHCWMLGVLGEVGRWVGGDGLEGGTSGQFVFASRSSRGSSSRGSSSGGSEGEGGKGARGVSERVVR